MHVQPLGQLLLQVYFALGFVLLDYFLLEISFTRFAHLSVTAHHNARAVTINLIPHLHDINIMAIKNGRSDAFKGYLHCKPLNFYGG